MHEIYMLFIVCLFLFGAFVFRRQDHHADVFTKVAADPQTLLTGGWQRWCCFCVSSRDSYSKKSPPGTLPMWPCFLVMGLVGFGNVFCLTSRSFPSLIANSILGPDEIEEKPPAGRAWHITRGDPRRGCCSHTYVWICARRARAPRMTQAHGPLCSGARSMVLCGLG